MNTCIAATWVVTPNGGVATRDTDTVFEQAWRTIHFELERRALHLMKGDRSAAEELVADTALKALLYMRRMPARIRNPQGFMFVVLNHVFLDRVRHADREGRVLRYIGDADEDAMLETAATTLSPAQVVELDETLSSIAAAVDALPGDKQRLFAMKFEQELSYASIADTLQINEALARKRVELLRRALRHAAEKQPGSKKNTSRAHSQRYR